MGTLALNIDDGLEKQFRDKAAQKYGMRKGNLTKALEEAIRQWVSG